MAGTTDGTTGVWRQHAGTWRQEAPGATATGGGTTWVVARDLDALARTAATLLPGDATARLVARHLAHEGPDRGFRARVDHGGDGRVVLTVPTVAFDARTGDVDTGWVTCVLGPGAVVMTEQGGAGVLAAAAARLTEGPAAPDEGERAVLAAVLLVLVQHAGRLEVGIGDAVARVEATVFAAEPTGDVLTDVYALKREIAEARRAIVPVGAALPDLDMWAQAPHTHRAPAWLERVRHDVDRIDRHLDGHDGLLGDMISVHLAQVSVRQNEDMRKISAWAAMIAVPTMVAGIYGMNFRHMPELTWPVGYPLAITAMAAASFGLWRAFRRSGWL